MIIRKFPPVPRGRTGRLGLWRPIKTALSGHIIVRVIPFFYGSINMQTKLTVHITVLATLPMLCAYRTDSRWIQGPFGALSNPTLLTRNIPLPSSLTTKSLPALRTNANFLQSTCQVCLSILPPISSLYPKDFLQRLPMFSHATMCLLPRAFWRLGESSKYS